MGTANKCLDVEVNWIVLFRKERNLNRIAERFRGRVAGERERERAREREKDGVITHTQ